MSALTALKFVAAKRPVAASPIVQRRNKISSRLWEQWHSPNSVDKYYCQNLNGRNANAKSQIHS